ncbi:MAG: hypothetical protein IPM34_13950 [Saprospiraceae bacterium]|nr:hypothetical protein [Saprospiraceae bacterium]
MKFRSGNIFFICIFLVACSSPKIGLYESGANDIARIQLVLLKNQTFELHFKDLDEKPEKNYIFKGKWTEIKDKIKLQFKLDKNGLPDLHALFDPSLTEIKSVKIIDKETVEFKKADKNIYIWGIACPKKKIEKPK